MAMLPPLILELRAQAGEVFTELGKVNASVEETAAKSESSMGRMESSFNKAASAGKILGAGVAIGAAVVGVESTKMAADFQQKMTLLVSAAGESKKNIGTVSSGILDLASSTGTSIDQLSEGMYTVEKAGDRGAAGLKVLKAAAQGAKAENVDLGTATNALTSVMASYGDKASKATSVENELVAASGRSKTTMQEFAGSLSTVLPLASRAGISFAQVGGAIATLTQHGTSADEATQELSNTITNLSGGNAVASETMQQFGINVQSLHENLGKNGLSGTLDIVENALKKNSQGGVEVVDAFKKSQTATQDLNIELGKMPASLAAQSKAFEDGKESYTDYNTAAKGLGGQQYQLAKGFEATVSKAQGFNQMLSSGNSAQMTSAQSLQKMLGGVTGMKTAMMLGGDSAGTFSKDVAAIGDAGKKSGSNVSSWAMTQKNLNVQLDQAKESVAVLGVKIGTVLIPVVQGALKMGSQWTNWAMKHKTTMEVLGGIIGGVVAVAILAYIAHLVVAGVQSVQAFGKMAASGAKWAAEQATSFASAVASGAAWVAEQAGQFATWVAEQAVTVADAVGTWLTYKVMQLQTAAETVAGWVSAGATQVASIAATGASSVASAAASGARFVATQAKTFAAAAAKGAAYAAATVVQGARTSAAWVAATAKSVVALAQQGIAVAAVKIPLLASAVATGVATAATWAWNAAMIVATAPVTLVILAIAALIAIIILVATHWSQVTGFLKSAWQSVGAFFVSAGKGFLEAWQQIWGTIASVATNLFKGFVSWIETSISGLELAFRTIGGKISAAWNGLWSGIGSIVKSAFGGVVSIIKTQANGIISVINGVISGINAVGSAGSAIGIHVPKIAKLPSFDVGGVIPGAVGQPTPILAHGGEVMLSTQMLAGQQPIPPQATAALDAAMRRAGSQSGATSTSKTNQVVVNAVTNATAQQIASAASWQLRRMA